MDDYGNEHLITLYVRRLESDSVHEVQVIKSSSSELDKDL